MKKYLLIDDLVNKGWKSVLEKAIIKEENSIHVASTYEEVLLNIDKKWECIFLDMRLNEQDHSFKNFSEYSGFKVLKIIRKDFNSTNFSTPVILITASNKIWNIDNFQENGIDAFYIKEHPDFLLDEHSSRENLENLQEAFKNLLIIGDKRNLIWSESNKIITTIGEHNYFTRGKRYINIKGRIIDKLKLGYAYSFKSPTKLETEVLSVNNEALAFIIYWSILEEVVKGFTDANTWDKSGCFSGNWKFRNGEYFIETLPDDSVKVNFLKVKNRDVNNEKGYLKDKKHSQKYRKGYINLSEQIYAFLVAYSNNKQCLNKLTSCFNSLNNFRNRVDFIHSSVINIYTKDLITKESKDSHFEFSVKVLKFLNEILSYK